MKKMTLKQLIKLENKAEEIWVVSPSLHYDVENKDFNEIVSVNLGEKAKYRYIVPENASIRKNMKLYQSMYKLTKEEMDNNFLLLPESEFNPFITETAIYDPTGECVACCAPATEDSKDVIRFNDQTAATMCKAFKSIWKRYKRSNP